MARNPTLNARQWYQTSIINLEEWPRCEESGSVTSHNFVLLVVQSPFPSDGVARIAKAATYKLLLTTLPPILQTLLWIRSIIWKQHLEKHVRLDMINRLRRALATRLRRPFPMVSSIRIPSLRKPVLNISNYSPVVPRSYH